MKYKKEDFFKDVSIVANGIDPETVKMVFYSMLKVLSRRLRSAREALMPDWGVFKLVLSKPRRIGDVQYERTVILPPKLTLKFSPDYKVREYFHEFGENSVKN